MVVVRGITLNEDVRAREPAEIRSGNSQHKPDTPLLRVRGVDAEPGIVDALLHRHAGVQKGEHGVFEPGVVAFDNAELHSGHDHLERQYGYA
jgi:hypothetical protein